MLAADMKLAISLLAAATCTHAMIYVPRFLQSLFESQTWSWPSSIPQFVLDTEHPWLEKNKTWLNRYPYVASALCSKDSDLWAKPDDPERTLPSDLFSTINIDNNRYGVDRFGWKNAAERLEELKRCPAALQDVKTLHIYVYVHDSKYDQLTESTLPPASLPALFAEVISSMTNLETLHWGISPESTHVFEAAFAEADVQLPTVKHLLPAINSEWLVSRCPDLESIQAGGFFHHGSWSVGDQKQCDGLAALIGAAKGSPIKKLSLFARNWEKTLGTILENTPAITTLEMDGDIRRGSSWDPDPEVLKQHLRLLARLPELKSLSLPNAGGLGLDFDGGPGCGNVYFGAKGREYGRKITQDGAETTEKAGQMTMEILPHLEQLKIGGSRANITRKDDGTVELRWRWTDRMEEYTYEVWPERPNP